MSLQSRTSLRSRCASLPCTCSHDGTIQIHCRLQRYVDDTQMTTCVEICASCTDESFSKFVYTDTEIVVYSRRCMSYTDEPPCRGCRAIAQYVESVLAEVCTHMTHRTFLPRAQNIFSDCLFLPNSFCGSLLFRGLWENTILSQAFR